MGDAFKEIGANELPWQYFIDPSVLGGIISP